MWFPGKRKGWSNHQKVHFSYFRMPQMNPKFWPTAAAVKAAQKEASNRSFSTRRPTMLLGFVLFNLSAWINSSNSSSSAYFSGVGLKFKMHSSNFIPLSWWTQRKLRRNTGLETKLKGSGCPNFCIRFMRQSCSLILSLRSDHILSLGGYIIQLSQVEQLSYLWLNSF